MTRWRKLGIVAGGGALPARLADACQRQGWPFFVIRIVDDTDPSLVQCPGVDCAVGEAGKVLRAVKDSECDAVVMAGVVRRPDFKSLKVDWRGAALLPKLALAARQGDAALIKVLVEMFEAEGLLVVGAEEVLQGLAAGEGVIAGRMPASQELDDIAKAAKLISAIGPFDVGQGAVVADGQVLAIEAVEGTDQMLARCGEETGPARGVLVKRPKPGQELRVDLPTIGPATIENIHAANIAGVAVEAGQALVIDLDEVVARAQELDIFVYGFRAEDVR